jgi:predicted nucleic acid-binding protein
MPALLVDTDVLIDYLRDEPNAVAYLEGLTEPAMVSTITVAELYAGVREGDERERLERFLLAFEVVAVDDEVAARGGLIRRDYGKSHGTGLADALIAASAELRSATLVTLNRKHFPMVPIHIPYRKS